MLECSRETEPIGYTHIRIHAHTRINIYTCSLSSLYKYGASLVTQIGNNLPAMQQSWVQSLGQKDPLEKGMATHSSIVSWRIPWTEGPGGLQSMGLQSQTRLSTNTPQICICFIIHMCRYKLHSTFYTHTHIYTHAFTGASQVPLVVKNPSANAGDVRDMGSTPGLGRSLREGNGYPFRDSCLENPMDRGAWQATVHGVAKSQTWPKPVNKHTRIFIYFKGLACTTTEAAKAKTCS